MEYFITFIDDLFRFTHLYLLNHKDDAFNAFKTFRVEVKNQLSISSKFLGNNRGMSTFLLNFIHIMKNMILYLVLRTSYTIIKWFRKKKKSHISRNDKCHVNALLIII